MNKEIDALVAKVEEAAYDMAMSDEGTRNVIRAALMEASALGLEEAAKVCDGQANEPECPERASYCAAAIRALKGE